MVSCIIRYLIEYRTRLQEPMVIILLVLIMDFINFLVVSFRYNLTQWHWPRIWVWCKLRDYSLVGSSGQKLLPCMKIMGINISSFWKLQSNSIQDRQSKPILSIKLSVTGKEFKIMWKSLYVCRFRLNIRGCNVIMCRWEEWEPIFHSRRS